MSRACRSWTHSTQWCTPLSYKKLEVWRYHRPAWSLKLLVEFSGKEGFVSGVWPPSSRCIDVVKNWSLLKTRPSLRRSWDPQHHIVSVKYKALPALRNAFFKMWSYGEFFLLRTVFCNLFLHCKFIFEYERGKVLKVVSFSREDQRIELQIYV